MDLELNLVKSDNEVWGFRLTGGADYDVPFIVINVSENSIAEKVGLRCDDVIVQVNGVLTTGLTHNETHELLLAAKNNLNLGIRRGATDVISPVICDSESNEEVATIMQASLESEEQFELDRQEYYELVNPLDEKNNVHENQNVEAQLVLDKQTTEVQRIHQAMSEVKERTWSTFLQKPKNPKPLPKKTEDTPKVEPYRVIIKKQKRKDSLELKSEKIEPSEERKVNGEKTEVQQENVRDLNVTPTKEVRFSDEVMEREDSEGEENAEQQKEVKEQQNGEVEEQSSQDSSVIEQETGSNGTESENEKNAQLDKLLEEKLIEVQKQLEALSRLPSTIQSTIDAVTKQLASIVHVTTASKSEDEKALSETNSEAGSDLAERIITEESDKEEDILERDQDVEEKNEVEIQSEGEKDEENVEQHTEEQQEVTKDEEVDAELIEKQKEAERIEKELIEKQQKEREQLEEFKQRRLKQKPTLPLKPVQRPIILPGGRRWSQPDDASSNVRQSKMSDEKIANTIETYSEVITGKTKGINFMKYQPPPKNLDYLQRSDVYKLVHDLEPPVRGISSRAPKILSAQDYFQAG